jgi:predicted O-methyltransferase YrrM
MLKPKNVVETGVAYGLSSSYILKALDKNQSGTLHSIDSIFRPWQSEDIIGAAIPENLRYRWNFNLGKSTEKLQQVFDELNDVDIFIHDSLHTYKNMMFEFECAEKNLNENGIIISDDVLDNDAFFNFSNRDNLNSHLIKVNDDLGLGLIIKN